MVSSLENVSFSNEFKLTVIAPIEVTVGSNKGGTKPEKKTPASGNKLQLPTIIEVGKDQWETEGFTSTSVLKIKDSRDALIFCFNLDNKFLKGEIRSARLSHKELTKQKYIYGMAMLALAAFSLVKDDDLAKVDENKTTLSSVEDIEKVCASYAPFIIPTLSMLNSITIEED